MKPLAILGASGHGKVVADTAELLGYQCQFFDDAWPNVTSNGHWPVVGDTQALLEQSHNFSGAVVAIGNNDIRQQKIDLLLKHHIALPVLKTFREKLFGRIIKTFTLALISKKDI